MARIQRHRIGTAVYLGDADPAQIDAAVAASPAILGMPTVATQNYTRHLSRYASLAAAIADLPDAGAGGGEIHVDGELTWTGTATVPANVHLIGRGKGATVLQMPASPTVPMLQLDSASGAMIADLAIILPDGTDAASGADGIHITGATNDLLIERVFIDRTSRGVNVEGWSGTTPGIVTNLTLRGVTTSHAESSYGITLDDVDGVTLDNCVSEYNHLDGVKLRKKAKNVTFMGGRYNHNGHIHETLGATGDGIDAYAGGDTVTFIGTEAGYNAGTGVTVKIGDTTTQDPAEYGYVRNVQATAMRCVGNGSIGFYVTTDPLVATAILVDTVTINGGLFMDNGEDGVYFAGRNITANGAVAKGNGRHGFATGARNMDLTMTGCLSIANSQSNPGAYNGFYLLGNGGRLTSCRAIGVNTDEVSDSADYDALTKYHSYGFRVGGTATGRWFFDGCESTYHVNPGTEGIRIDATSGIFVTDLTLAANPGATAHGSIGSRAINVNAATAADAVWAKTSGTPNSGLTGWSRVNVT